MEPIKIFYCCTNTSEDKMLRAQLEIHLKILKRFKQITLCLTREILGGRDWRYEQDERFQKADLILLLVSPDFIDSDYHYSIEMRNALEKHDAGNVWVLPIILRPTPLVEQTPFGRLPMLPPNAVPITMHTNRDAAFKTVVEEISKVVLKLLTQKYGFTSLASTTKSSTGTQLALFTCDTCGIQNLPGVSTCRNCKDLLLTDTEVASLLTLNAVDSVENRLICLTCGFENREGAKFCQQDGKPLPQNAQMPIHYVPSKQKKLPQITKNNPFTTLSPEAVQFSNNTMAWSSNSTVSLGYLIRTPFLPVKGLVPNGRIFTNDRQAVHVLLEIKQTERPLNIALVIDHSGSMRGAKQKNVKEAAKMVIDCLEPTDYISVVIFDDTSQVIVPSMPANDKPGMNAAIDRIQDAGGSTMSLGMISGFGELKRWNIPYAVKYMILLTDGWTYGDTDRCLQLARDAATAGISIQSLGVGADWNESLLDHISLLSDGLPATFMQNPNQALNLIQQLSFPRSLGVVMRNLLLTLYLSTGVTLKKVVKVLPMIGDVGLSALSDRRIEIPLNNLEKDKLQCMLFELMIDQRHAGPFRLAQAELSYYMSLSGITESIRNDITVTFTDNVDQVMNIDAKVTNFIEKVNW